MENIENLQFYFFQRQMGQLICGITCPGDEKLRNGQTFKKKHFYESA